MKKTIYAISGYIPSDENVVVINIYKLIKYGQDNVKYGWVEITGEEGNGIGTSTNDFGGVDKIDELLKINMYLDNYGIVGKFTFEEVMGKYIEFKENLTKELKF
jgi:hypothetical protein